MLMNYFKETQITVTEDEALGKGISIETLIQEKQEMGFVPITEYSHPAVGRCVVMEHKPNMKQLLEEFLHLSRVYNLKFPIEEED